MERDGIRNGLAQLRGKADELRAGIGTLEDRLGDAAGSAAVARGRTLQRVGEAAGAVAATVATRAGHGVAAVRDGVEHRPFASVALVFLVGVAAGSLLAGARLTAVESFLASVRDAFARERPAVA
jgi:X-X-X-Leu-X-X-Gly heptad repeat protein